MNTVQNRRKPPAQRNFVAKHAQRSGAGTHDHTPFATRRAKALEQRDRLDYFNAISFWR